VRRFFVLPAVSTENVRHGTYAPFLITYVAAAQIFECLVENGGLNTGGE
jgi:hypothetical protein